MSDVFTSIGKGLGAAELEVAKATGVKLQFSHCGATVINIYAIIIDIAAGSEKYNEHRVIKKHELTLRIAVQTGIPFESDKNISPITKGDQFIYNGRNYYCADNVKLLANGYIYQVIVESDRTLDTALAS